MNCLPKLEKHVVLLLRTSMRKIQKGRKPLSKRSSKMIRNLKASKLVLINYVQKLSRRIFHLLLNKNKEKAESCRLISLVLWVVFWV